MKKAGLAVMLLVVCFTVLAEGMAESTLIDTLRNHLDLFVTNNFPGQMVYTASEYETIGPGSDLPALADLITLNFYVIDETAAQYVQFAGGEKGRQKFISQVLMPKMIDGALIARVDWTWGPSQATEYALVDPSATPGDVNTILDGIAGGYIKKKPILESHSNSVSYSYVNGFGWDAVHFEAYVTCVANQCVPHVLAIAYLPLFGADYKMKVWCENNICIMDVAFVGTRGWPSVEFEADKFKFKVGGWGDAFHNSYDRLTEPCPCTPKPEPVGCNKISDALSLPDSTRVYLTDKSVTMHRLDLGKGWIEEKDRSSAIQLGTEVPLHTGMEVTVVGELKTIQANRQIVVEPEWLQMKLSDEIIRPVFMTNRTLGGEDRLPFTPGATLGNGLNNIGMLVMTSGRVTAILPPYFFIDDGSGVVDETGLKGVRVFSEYYPIPPLREYVLVIGTVNAVMGEMTPHISPMIIPTRKPVGILSSKLASKS